MLIDMIINILLIFIFILTGLVFGTWLIANNFKEALKIILRKN